MGITGDLLHLRCIALLLRTVCPPRRTPTYSMETLWIEERNLQRLSSFCLPSYCSTPITCIWTEAIMRTTSWTSGNMRSRIQMITEAMTFNKPHKSSSMVNASWRWKTKRYTASTTPSESNLFFLNDLKKIISVGE